MWVTPMASVTPAAAAAVPTMPTLPKLTPFGAISPSDCTRMKVPGTICSAKLSSIANSFPVRGLRLAPWRGVQGGRSRAAFQLIKRARSGVLQ
jgi:hypothetical protein